MIHNCLKVRRGAARGRLGKVSDGMKGLTGVRFKAHESRVTSLWAALRFREVANYRRNNPRVYQMQRIHLLTRRHPRMAAQIPCHARVAMGFPNPGVVHFQKERIVGFLTGLPSPISIRLEPRRSRPGRQSAFRYAPLVLHPWNPMPMRRILSQTEYPKRPRIGSQPSPFPHAATMIG